MGHAINETRNRVEPREEQELEIARTRQTLINTVSGICNKGIAIVFPFVIRTFIIKILGDDYVGLNSLFTSIFTVLNLAELGFSSAVVFSMYRPIAEDNTVVICALLRYYRRIYRFVALIIAAAGLALLPFLPHLVKGDAPADINLYVLYLMYLGSTVMGYLLFAYRVSLFSAHQRNDILTNVSTVILLAQYLLQILALTVLRNYYAYTLVGALMVIPQNLCYYWLSRRTYARYSCRGNLPDSFKAQIHQQVAALMGHKIGATVLVSIDSVLISSFLGLGALAVYGNYYSLAMAVIAVTNVATQSMLAGIGNKLVTGSAESAYQLFRHLSYLWVWCVGWCATCLLCLSGPFVRIWLGSSYCYPTATVCAIALYYFCWQFRVLGLTFKDAAGLWKMDWYKPYLGMGLNLAGSILMLIVLRHVVSVLVPTMVVMALIYFPIETHVIFQKIFHCSSKRYVSRLLVQIALLFFCALVTFLLCGMISLPGIWDLAAKTAVCFLVPNLIFAAATCRTEPFRFLSQTVRSMRELIRH